MGSRSRQPNSGVAVNPCKGISRNPESKRERYVEHEEYAVIRKRAVKSVRALMDLVYRTLQRPEDIIEWGPKNIVRKREPDGSVRRVIRNDQAKTGAIVDILITPEIDSILADLNATVAAGPGMPFLHTRKGEPYTYAGLSAMFRRYVANSLSKGDIRESFTLYDLKGKGATDMWLRGTPLEIIQVLCGHDSVTTTEKYVKTRWRGTVEPNRTDMSVG